MIMCVTGGNEEVKDGACGDGYSNLRQWPYSEWKEMPHYPDPSRFFHITQSSHLTPPTAAGFVTVVFVCPTLEHEAVVQLSPTFCYPHWNMKL